ncbi:MAG: hypothetical protein ACFFCW_27520 [Candidatus Hodarchaeota archaeon]
MSTFYKFSGFSNILCALLLFLSWFSIGIFMWNEISSQNFSAMVQNPAWIPVNVFYLVATILLIPGIFALYFKQAEKSGTLGLVAFWITILAIIWYTCIQFYETFFWPIIAAESPSLFQAVGFSPSNDIIYMQLMLSAIPWAVGFILLGMITIKAEFVAKWTVWIFTIGALLFGVGIMFPIRSIGVVLFSYGLVKYGNAIRKV